MSTITPSIFIKICILTIILCLLYKETQADKMQEKMSCIEREMQYNDVAHNTDYLNIFGF